MYNNYIVTLNNSSITDTILCSKDIQWYNGIGIVLKNINAK